MNPLLSPVEALVAVSEEPRQYLLKMELPGLAREQVEVDVEQDTLRIWSRPAQPSPSFGRASRQPLEVMSAWKLPHDVDPCSVVADFRNGLLQVRLPRLVRQRSWWPF